MPDAEQLTAARAEWFGRLPTALIDEGRIQAAAALALFPGPADQPRQQVVVSHGNLINWFVSEA